MRSVTGPHAGLRDEDIMLRQATIAAFATALVASGTAATAQGVVQGSRQGEAAGERVGGPVGGVVGSVIGGVVGGVNGAVDGILGRDARPRFREYVVRENRPSYTFGNDVRVGVMLPDTGITYYEVPAEYGSGYRYTVLNGRTVLVDRTTNRVVEVID